MKLTSVLVLSLSVLLLSEAYGQSAYTLKEGDILSISVWGEEDLDRETRVLPDGSISFPLVGNIKASGMTASQVEKQMAREISNYIPDANVSVVVMNTEGNRIYVLGNVNNPGSFIMSSPLSAVQALSLAGGLSTFADENDILIIRQNGAEQTRLPIRYSDILSGKNLQSNHQLKAGDTILVP